MYSVEKKSKKSAFDPICVCLVCAGRSGDRVVGTQRPSNPPAPDDQTLIHQQTRKSKTFRHWEFVLGKYFYYQRSFRQPLPVTAQKLQSHELQI